MQHFISAKALRPLVILILLTALLVPAPFYRQAHAGQDFVLYLPLAAAATATPPPSAAPEQIALDRINFYRNLAGSPLLQLHGALVAAAKNHANYTVVNKNDPSAWANGPHGEVIGKPYFSGQMPGDRAVATGYPWTAGWEVMSYYGDPTRSVDSLMATVYHRIGILETTVQYAGYGNARAGSYADVIDFGRGATNLTGQPGIIVYPAANQADVPLQGSSEQPSSLPPDASYPVGYHITLQPIYGTALTVTQAELRDGSGAMVSVYPSPSDCGTTCYAMTPVAPLKPATTYMVHVVGTVDGVSFDKTWEFITKSCPTPLDC